MGTSNVFNQPMFLRLIPAAVVAVFALTFLLGRVSRGTVERFGKYRTLARFSILKIARWRNSFYLALILSILLVALADPVLLYHKQVSGQTFSYIAVVDVSRSAGAEDYPAMVPRIAMSRRSLLALYDAYPLGAVGMVLFTDQATPYQVTTDHEVVRYLTLYATNLEGVKGSGSDLCLALAAALDLIKDSPQALRTIVLLTDGGGETMAGVQQIAKQLVEARIAVIAGGLGGYEPAKIPARDRKTGEIVGYHRYHGEIAMTALNEEPLIALAEVTGGKYVHIIRGDELVQVVRRGDYANDVVLAESKEQKSLTDKVLVALLVVLFVWLLDKRFVQGWA